MDETRELTGGWLEEFSKPWSEVCPCQSQGSRGGEFFGVHSPVQLFN